VSKRKVVINALAALLQSVLTGVSLFILYKFLIFSLGADSFGIWSLVMAFSSFAQFANLGLSGTVVKYVAGHIARGDTHKAAEVIQTAAISIFTITGVIVFFAEPVLEMVLPLFIAGYPLAQATELLPWALLSFWLMAMAAVFLSALDGYFCVVLKSSILVLVSVLNLLLCLYTVPVYGVKGVAYSTVFANFIALLFGWIAIRNKNVELPAIPYKWRKAVFLEIIGYAGSFQLISIAGMFGESIIKAFLGKFGSLASVGYYEMATRLVLQIRGLLISAYQVLVPFLANLNERDPGKVMHVYRKAYSLLYYLAFPVFLLLAISMPLVSIIWIGYVDELFVFLGRLVVLGWFLNTLAVPAYVLSLGLGDLRWNVRGHALTALLNIGFGYLGGVFFGISGVVAAAVVSLVLGSILISIPVTLSRGVSISEYIPADSRGMTLLLSLLLFMAIPSQDRLQIMGGLVPHAVFAAIAVLVGMAIVYRHPMRGYIMDSFFAAFRK